MRSSLDYYYRHLKQKSAIFAVNIWPPDRLYKRRPVRRYWRGCCPSRSSPLRVVGTLACKIPRATARPVRISRVLAVVLFPSGWQFRCRSGEKTIHPVLRPTEAPPFMRGYSCADLPYEQPTKTDPDGECGSSWQDDIIINHFHYEPCHPHKECRHNDP